MLRSQPKEVWTVSKLASEIVSLSSKDKHLGCPCNSSVARTIAHCQFPHLILTTVPIKIPDYPASFPQAETVSPLKLLSTSQISEMFDTETYVFWQLCLIHILKGKLKLHKVWKRLVECFGIWWKADRIPSSFCSLPFPFTCRYLLYKSCHWNESFN